MGFNNLRIVLIIKGCYKVKSIRPKSFFWGGRILIIQKSKYPEILHLLRFQNVEIHSCFHFGYLDIVNFDAYQKEQLTSFSAFLFWILRICPKQCVPRFCNQAFSGFQWILLERSLPKTSCFWTSDLKQWQLSRSIRNV